jgi:Protein of unknown function (DUF3604)
MAGGAMLQRFYLGVMLIALSAVSAGCSRPFDDAGSVSKGPAPRENLIEEVPADPLHGAKPAKQILFGDLHGHTSFSLDAYEKGMSMVNGEGRRPPADACDFARYCSQLDFWSINDHAEFLNQQRWANIRDTVRQCNEVAGDSANPDMVTFLGWEWTQIGREPALHYGHKNIILRDIAEDRVPSHAIAAPPSDRQFNVQLPAMDMLRERLLRMIDDPDNILEHLNYLRFLFSGLGESACSAGDSEAGPQGDCKAYAATPGELYRQLEANGSEYMVIPHGNSWGLYTPPAADWRKQLQGDTAMPGRQPLLEVYSGHGNSEEYRNWRASQQSDTEMHCPQPSENYTPCCWRAGEIVRQRCADAADMQCEAEVARARQNYVDAGSSGHLTLTGVSEADWLNCGQCTDCFLPAFNFRPGTSSQAALAVRENGARFRFGLIGSSDNHSARPGTGYKEYARLPMTDGRGPSDAWQNIRPAQAEEEVRSRPPAEINASSDNVFERSRVSSFYTTGGLVAVHSRGRDRAAIWDALMAKEVYGTSGPRIQLWFDLLDESQGALPMGSDTTRHAAPEFRVQAYGALTQKPGCPQSSVSALGEERLQSLCGNECFSPGNSRHPLIRLEIVRIRPQNYSGEPLADLIEDPWRVFPCEGRGAGCSAQFSDPDFSELGRDTVYYARAVQAATPTINAGGLRCEYDDSGHCIAVDPCYADSRTDPADDCLAPAEHRAWSSPIFVDYAAP